MKKDPTESEDTELDPAWAAALEMVDADLARRGSAELTRRAYASDLMAFARHDAVVLYADVYEE